jgi:mannan endo-1,4-beta-mannosidase
LASGATVSLSWDAGASAYKGSVGSLKAVLTSHYDGILELQLKDGAGAQAPQKPTGFAKPTSSGITATGAKISWKAPTGGDAVTGYSVSVKAGATAIAGSPFTVAKGTLNKVLTGLTTKTAYTVVVTATNSAGSLAATALTVTTI